MRAIPWAAAILAVGLAVGCTLPVMPAQEALPPPPDATTQQVFVRLDSTSPSAALVRMGADGGVECVAPCARPVTIQEGALYEIHARGRLPTASFEVYSKEDDQAWLVHDGVSPGTKWGLGAATAISGGLGLGLLVTGGALNNESVRMDSPDLPLAVGLSGLILGVPVCALFGVLTAVYSDSHHSFKDPALPGFRF